MFIIKCLANNFGSVYAARLVDKEKRTFNQRIKS